MNDPALTLTRFRVSNFRSVEDSGWLDADEVTALIGTNESGKTNLLLPLWKLNPAKDGAIDALADYPRKRFNEIRVMEKKPIFIRAEFKISEELVREAASHLRVAPEAVKRTVISRDFDGKYHVDFPDIPATRVIDSAEIIQAADELNSINPGIRHYTKRRTAKAEHANGVEREPREGSYSSQ